MVRGAAGSLQCHKVWFHAAVTAGLLPEGQDRCKPRDTWALHLDLLTHGLAYLESAQVLGTGSAHWCASCLPQIQPQHRVQVWFSFSWSYVLGSKHIFPSGRKFCCEDFRHEHGLLFCAGFFLALVARSDSAEVAEGITHPGLSNPRRSYNMRTPWHCTAPFPGSTLSLLHGKTKEAALAVRLVCFESHRLPLKWWMAPSQRQTRSCRRRAASPAGQPHLPAGGTGGRDPPP